MAKRAVRNRPLLTLNHSVKIEIREAILTPLGSIKHLDVAKLKKAARAEVELGYIEGGCCSQLVRAVIRKGMVTDIAIEQCPDVAKATPDLARLLNTARRKAKAALRGRTDSYPMPVETFFTNAALSIKTLVCYQICLFGWCISCCTRTDIANDWHCGRITIDTTSGPYPE